MLQITQYHNLLLGLETHNKHGKFYSIMQQIFQIINGV
jgi:hypothetical protein